MPGSPYYVTDNGYPAYNPTKAKALVKQVETETGKPVAFTLITTRAYSTQVAEFLQHQLEAVGMQVTLTQVQQADQINTALLGTFQATSWRQFGAVDPDLNYIFWSPTEIFGTGPSVAINMARNTDPDMETLLSRAASRPTRPTGPPPTRRWPSD